MTDAMAMRMFSRGVVVGLFIRALHWLDELGALDRLEPPICSFEGPLEAPPEPLGIAPSRLGLHKEAPAAGCSRKRHRLPARRSATAGYRRMSIWYSGWGSPWTTIAPPIAIAAMMLSTCSMGSSFRLEAAGRMLGDGDVGGHPAGGRVPPCASSCSEAAVAVVRAGRVRRVPHQRTRRARGERALCDWRRAAC
jgi:hypothetical protein